MNEPVITDVGAAIASSLARLGITANLEVNEGMATVGNVCLPVALLWMASEASMVKPNE
jgi:hypothetical protein